MPVHDIDSQQVLVLQPKFRLRNEETRVLLYGVSESDSSIEMFLFIHHAWALLLTFFDGARTGREAVDLFQQVSEVDSRPEAVDRIRQILGALEEKFGEPLVVDSSTVPARKAVYDPFEFIVPHESIDLGRDGRRLRTPLSINYIVTDNCFRRCIYCFAELLTPKRKHLPLTRVKEIFDEAKSIEVCNITFSGGDPFARRDFLTILEYVLGLGFEVFVSTKAYLSPRTCARLAAMGLNWLQLSVDAAQDDMANYMTQSPRFFPQFNETLQNLKEMGILVFTKSVITPYNMTGVPNLLEFLYRNGVRRANLSAYGRSAFRHSDSFFLRPRDHTWLREQVDRVKSAHDDFEVSLSDLDDGTSLSREERKRRFGERAGCSAGASALTVLPDGKILSCEQMPTSDEFIAGDLSRQSIREVWNSEPMREILMPPRERFIGTPCFACGDFESCHMLLGRCFRDAYNLFENAYAPDPKCPKAPLQRPRLA